MSSSLSSTELALACYRAANEIQADYIQLWDLRGVAGITDYMMICSGNSMPHLKAILREISGLIHEQHGVRPVYSEGKADSRWVILDYIDVMVHIMHQEMRDLYQLEQLWPKAKKVDLLG